MDISEVKIPALARKRDNSNCPLDILASDFENICKTAVFKPNLEYAARTHSKVVRMIKSQPDLEVIKEKKLIRKDIKSVRKALENDYCKTNQCGIYPCWKSKDARKKR